MASSYAEQELPLPGPCSLGDCSRGRGRKSPPLPPTSPSPLRSRTAHSIPALLGIPQAGHSPSLGVSVPVCETNESPTCCWPGLAAVRPTDVRVLLQASAPGPLVQESSREHLPHPPNPSALGAGTALVFERLLRAQHCGKLHTSLTDVTALRCCSVSPAQRPEPPGPSPGLRVPESLLL